MTRTFQWIAWLIVLVFPSVCSAAFRIDLLNGGSFVTDQYWQEDQEIKLYFRGGMLGVKRDSVKQIVETDVSANLLPAETGIQRKAEPMVSAVHQKKIESGTELSLADRIRKKELDEKMRYSNEAFIQANLKGDLANKKKAREEYQRYREELSGLLKEVVEKTQGKVPDWWQQ